MGPPPLVLDALWRCLCPSVASLASLRVVPSAYQSSAIRLSKRRPHSRCTSPWKAASLSFLTTAASGRTGTTDFRNHVNTRIVEDSLVHLSTEELYKRLRARATMGGHREVMQIVKVLVKDRQQPPSLQLYSDILLSFVSANEVTGGAIRRILEEMAHEGIELDSRACHHVLEALAVHPDYLLRNEILDYMRVRWFTLTDSGHNFVVAGLLRDRCFEQALEKIDHMVQQGIAVAPWVYDKAMYLLLENQDIDEAYHLAMQRQSSHSKNMSYSLWMHLLACASQLHHADAVNFVWNSRVVHSYLNPPTGTCMNVLNMASRNGDVKLATDVFQVLTERGVAFERRHYEMLLETYLNAGDLNAALSVLLIMQDSGLQADEGTLLPLYSYMIKSPSRPMDTFSEIRNLEHEGGKIPTAAVNRCIQASIHFNNLTDAIEMYKVLHTVSELGPNTDTFNYLFQGCHKEGKGELAMFLVQEMLQLKVPPNALTYDRLILINYSTGNIENAMLYYKEMKDLEFRPRRGTLDLLRKVGQQIDHPLVGDILDDMRAMGYYISGNKDPGANAAHDANREQKPDDGYAELVAMTDGASFDEKAAGQN